MRRESARSFAGILILSILLEPALAVSARAGCYAVYDGSYRSKMASAGMPIPEKVAAPASVTTPEQCRSWLSQKISGYGYDTGLQKTRCDCGTGGSAGGYSGGYSGMSTKQMVQTEMAGMMGNMLGNMIAAALAPPVQRGPSPEEIARQEQEKARLEAERLEAERQAKIRKEQEEKWKAANRQIASAGGKARETEAAQGTALLGQMSTLGGGQGMGMGTLSSHGLSLGDMTSLGSGRYDTSRMDLRQRLLCASAFSKDAAAVAGKNPEESRRLGEQADRVLSGAPTDRECPPFATLGVPEVPEPTPVGLPEEYAGILRETRQDIDALQGFREEKEKTAEKKKEVETKLAETREKAKEAKAAPVPEKPEPGKDSTLLAELKALEADLAAELSDLDKKEKELSSSIENVTGRLQKRQQSLLAEAGPKSPTGGLK